MTIKYPLTIFFDGGCGVCSTEISYYQKIADQRIEFVDIAAEDFDARAFGKSIDEFQAKLHARDADNQYYTGVEAFRRLWETLPAPFYPLLSTFVGLPGIHFASSVAYTLFARYRHLLPANHTKNCPIAKQQ